jgi:hypothetical protein
MEQDIGQRRPATETDRLKVESASATREDTERPKEYFSVRPTMSGSAHEFEDPRLAGEAFFRADPAERPSVTHVDGNTARTMARTEIHGPHENGETRYFKSLPDSHAPDAAFREEFLAAMETSIAERLEKLDRGDGGANIVERLDSGLMDDLEAFARYEPEKAAALWTDRTDEPAPGPTLQAAVQAREAEANAEVAAYQAALAEKPPVIATGDWVTTDQDVDLRPIAIATERGVHAGFEAKLPGGEQEISFSERTFADSREALRHAWDFYEGGEEGLELAVTRSATLDRDLEDEPDRTWSRLVLEHRDQPEFPRPEAAIYAGEDAQLVMTLGRDNEATRALAEDLVAHAAFRKLVAEHIPDVEARLGTGTFTDGADSRGFLPDELLVVTSYGRDVGAEVLAKFPDEGPLSEALARHLTTSPVLAAYAEAEQGREEVARDPAWAISDWVARASARIDRLPPDRQDDLRAEMQDIAKEVAVAFGVDREREGNDAPPRSSIYSTAITATSLVAGEEKIDFSAEAGAALKTGLRAAAEAAGLDGAKIEHRLEAGAANAREEESWVRSDIAEVAARHRLDLGDDKARGRAAELVDRFYEKAAVLVHTARAVEVRREQDPLLTALGTMAKVHGTQGSVSFRNEDQARDFAEEMKDRYGAAVLKDMAAGRTDAIEQDIPDPAARQAMAAAVVSAAKEHPALGLSVHEAETAERKLAAEAQSQDRPPEHAHDRNRAQDRDREF